MSNHNEENKFKNIQQGADALKPLTEEDEKHIKGGSGGSETCPTGEHWDSKEQKCVLTIPNVPV